MPTGGSTARVAPLTPLFSALRSHHGTSVCLFSLHPPVSPCLFLSFLASAYRCRVSSDESLYVSLPLVLSELVSLSLDYRFLSIPQVSFLASRRLSSLFLSLSLSPPTASVYLLCVNSLSVTLFLSIAVLMCMRMYIYVRLSRPHLQTAKFGRIHAATCLRHLVQYYRRGASGDSTAPFSVDRRSLSPWHAFSLSLSLPFSRRNVPSLSLSLSSPFSLSLTLFDNKSYQRDSSILLLACISRTCVYSSVRRMSAQYVT